MFRRKKRFLSETLIETGIGSRREVAVIHWLLTSLTRLKLVHLLAASLFGLASAEALASGLGMRDLYLLTESAVEWFPGLGYAVLDRASAPDGIAGSWEFRFACAERGVLMRRSLGG